MAKAPDWEAIEKAYRAGSMSIRAIADKYGTKEGTIRSRAKKNGWMRDLSEQVKASVSDRLSRTTSRAALTRDVMRDDARTDAEIIEEAATEAAGVVVAHRMSLARWRGIADKLMLALADMDVTEDNHAGFARSLNAGVDAQLKIIKGERQAYNLDTEEGDKTVSDLSALMDELSQEA